MLCSTNVNHVGLLFPTPGIIKLIEVTNEKNENSVTILILVITTIINTEKIIIKINNLLEGNKIDYDDNFSVLTVTNNHRINGVGKKGKACHNNL